MATEVEILCLQAVQFLLFSLKVSQFLTVQIVQIQIPIYYLH